jgi:NAD-dependent SIR2 family protein deacetylase
LIAINTCSLTVRTMWFDSPAFALSVHLPACFHRYWARSFAGWHEFAFVQPNAAHEAIARLQGRGWLDLIITQNVDRLHHKGGSEAVLELHGTTHRLVDVWRGFMI